jgi:hypothetical protein
MKAILINYETLNDNSGTSTIIFKSLFKHKDK